MTAISQHPDAGTRPATPPPRPRFGGILWRLARTTTPLVMPLAGRAWNPIFAVVEHRGRRTGRRFSVPVGARRVAGGFVISLAFGAQVDWYLNLLVADGGTILWRGQRYPIGRPERLDAPTALEAFRPVQRALLRIAAVDGYVRVRDQDPLGR